ncbi:MAG: CIA30 family protein [Wenzhouxiangella sp.]
MRLLMMWIALPPLVVVLVLALPTPPANDVAHTQADGFVISGARVFDGQGFKEGLDVWVRDGRVDAVGRNLDLPPGVQRIDAAGKTLLPGLIDAHTHTFGQARQDALRLGVTTLLDMFTSPSMLPQAREQRDRFDQATQADLYSAGLLATARSGHGTQYGIPVPTLAEPDEAEAWVAARQAEGSDFIKIVIEPGRLWGSPLPTLDEPTVRALVQAAHASGLLALAHVSMEADAIMAIEAGVDGLVHLFADRPASPAFVKLALQRDVFVVPTAVVMAGVGGQINVDALLAEPGIARRLSEEQQASLRGGGWQAPNGEALLARTLANLHALQAAGVPLLAGSDAPNPGTAHGLSVHLELAYLVEAGMSTAQALNSATGLPAQRFGLEGRGCIAPGCRADLLLVDGDPEADIRATRQIAAVWKNGRTVALGPVTMAAVSAQGDAAHDLLSADEMGRWVAADDRFMGGQSQAKLAVTDAGTLKVSGNLAAGFAYPYAGAIWSPGQPFMSPVDFSDRSRLSLRLHGEAGLYTLMLFSGRVPGQSQPLQFPMVAETDGASLSLDLATLDGLNLAQFQAFGVFANGDARPFSFELTEAWLE